MGIDAKSLAGLLYSHFGDGDSTASPWNDIHYELDTEVSTYLGEDVYIYQVATGGGMDKGINGYTVIKVVTDEVQYFRKDGYYASYDGFEWDGDFYQVYPYEKTITVFEDINSLNRFDGATATVIDSFGDE